MSSIIEQTWEDLGYKIRPTRHRVLVRTEPVPALTKGGIIIPDTYRGLYEGPFHLRLINAYVLRIGEGVNEVKVNERVCFQRKWFIRHRLLGFDQAVGWIKESEIAGILDAETSVEKYITYVEGDNAVRADPT